MVAFMRILLCDFEWHRFERKGKLPETIVDADVSAVCKAVISERLARYSGSLEVGPPTCLLHDELE
jgi:hypothetical protein